MSHQASLWLLHTESAVKSLTYRDLVLIEGAYDAEVHDKTTLRGAHQQVLIVLEKLSRDPVVLNVPIGIIWAADGFSSSWVDQSLIIKPMLSCSGSIWISPLAIAPAAIWVIRRVPIWRELWWCYLLLLAGRLLRPLHIVLLLLIHLLFDHDCVDWLS